MKPKNIVIVVALGVTLFLLNKLPLVDYLSGAIGWFEGFGAWAPVLYFLFFVLSSGTIFPVFLLSIGAGIIFGLINGAVIVSLGNLLSAAIMFFMARKFGRKWFDNKFQNNAMVQKIGRAIEIEGWKMLFMLRVVPVVHMILLNITCGVSKLRVKQYLFGTWLGMLPLLILYVYIGTVTESVIASPTQFFASQSFLFYVPGIVLVTVFSIYMKRIHQKYLTVEVRSKGYGRNENATY